MAEFIDQVDGWPVVVFVSIPGGTIIILSDRILDPKILNGLFQIIQVSFVREFRDSDFRS